MVNVDSGENTERREKSPRQSPRFATEVIRSIFSSFVEISSIFRIYAMIQNSMNRCFVALMVLFASLAAAFAQPGCDKIDQDTGSSLDLSSAERVFVRMQGFPDLSSEYRVNSDNTISIPVIGRVSVAGVTPNCLEKMVSADATRIAKREVFVTVEIVEYKPVFITGAVSTPGAVHWFPGMTVLQATALAGGLYRAPLSNEAVEDPMKIRRLTDSHWRLIAKLTRLKGELEGSTTLLPPVDLAKSAPAETAALFEAEQGLMDSRQAALQNDVAALDRGMSVAREELNALVQTKASLERQLEVHRSVRDKLDGLQKKGIIVLERVQREEQLIADLEMRVLDNSVARTRVSATLAGLEREAGALGIGRRATIGADINQVEGDLSLNSIELQGARLSVGLTVSADGAVTITYTVVRRAGENSRRISAAETDILNAGDVLIVAQMVR